jgi:hypothetical protein
MVEACGMRKEQRHAVSRRGEGAFESASNLMGNRPF